MFGIIKLITKSEEPQSTPHPSPTAPTSPTRGEVI
jgi:hypothetical protein